MPAPGSCTVDYKELAMSSVCCPPQCLMGMETKAKPQIANPTTESPVQESY